jgi:aminomethyltransferase
MILKTPLYDKHVADNAKMVDFAGWSMPIQYESITAEHELIREKAGLFDVSHMGRFYLEGNDAAETLNQLVVSRVHDLEANQVRYSVVCNPEGGTKDDVIYTRLSESKFLIVVNASNREKLVPWFESHLLGDTTFLDQTMDSGMIALQGPESQSHLSELLKVDFSSLKSFHAQELPNNILVSRTGYTGEDGFELIAPAEQTALLWQQLRECEIRPAGLGARDTLRLEMGYSLYGHEITEKVSPVQAGLLWVIHWDKPEFIGKEPLVDQKENGSVIKRIGYVIAGRGIPRQGNEIMLDNNTIGETTSGGYSPTIKKGIGLALVKRETAKDAAITVQIRNKQIPATITRPPFIQK